MELAQLEIFLAVVEEGSVTGAARRLHRVPSNVTTRLKQLEVELGKDLFVREKLRLRLSPTGTAFLKYARRILSLVSEACTTVVGDQPHGVFAIGSLESTAAVRLPKVLATFYQRYPRVQLDLSTGFSSVMIEGVVEGRLAAAFADGPIRHHALEGQPAFVEQMMVVAPRGHHRIDSVSHVPGATVYAFRSDCSNRRHFESWFASENQMPGKIFEMESYHGMLACVSAGADIAMMPLSMLTSMLGADQVEAFPVRGAFAEVQIWMAWRKGHLHPNVQALGNVLKTFNQTCTSGKRKCRSPFGGSVCLTMQATLAEQWSARKKSLRSQSPQA